jgi:hypothetical protein
LARAHRADLLAGVPIATHHAEDLATLARDAQRTSLPNDVAASFRYVQKRLTLNA